jgi:hypothetical protein
VGESVDVVLGRDALRVADHQVDFGERAEAYGRAGAPR